VRVIVLALVIANILFFGWQYWIGRHSVPPPANPYRDVPELELAPARLPGLEAMSEAPTGDNQADQDFTGTGDAAEVVTAEQALSADQAPILPRVCARLGRFGDEASAAGALAALGKSTNFLQADPVTRIGTVGGTQVSFWVYLPPFLDRKTANMALSALAQRGIRDAYIVGEGEDQNAISLGLFSEQDRAKRRVRQLEESGMTATISRLERPSTDYVIDVALSSRNAIGSEELASLGPEITLEEIPCEAWSRDDR
jgi:hypothetical protein